MEPNGSACWGALCPPPRHVFCVRTWWGNQPCSTGGNNQSSRRGRRGRNNSHTPFSGALCTFQTFTHYLRALREDRASSPFHRGGMGTCPWAHRTFVLKQGPRSWGRGVSIPALWPPCATGIMERGCQAAGAPAPRGAEFSSMGATPRDLELTQQALCPPPHIVCSTGFSGSEWFSQPGHKVKQLSVML